jgi:hypothetical protein
MTNTDSWQSEERDYLDEFGDLDAAVDVIRTMRDQPDGPTDEEGFDRDLRAKLGTDLQIRDFRVGCMTLVGMLGALIQDPLDIIPPAIRKLRELEEIPDDVLPMVAAGLAATFLRQSDGQWRDRYGPVPRAESLAWLYAAWYLVDFIDYVKGEHGAALRTLEELAPTVSAQEAAGDDQPVQ